MNKQKRQTKKGKSMAKTDDITFDDLFNQTRHQELTKQDDEEGGEEESS
jgi:hypothetical protein